MRTLLLSLWLGAAPAVAGEHAVDPYCGPRAVAVVLDALRPEGARHVDLIDVIAELLPPGERTRTSLAELAACLEARGVATRAVRLPVDRLPDHGRPVILHLRADGDGPGHFAMLRRASDGTSYLDHGMTREPVGGAGLAHRWSGVALLTARTRADLPPVAAAASRSSFRLLLGASAAALLTAGGLLLRRRRPRAPRPPPSPVRLTS